MSPLLKVSAATTGLCFLTHDYRVNNEVDRTTLHFREQLHSGIGLFQSLWRAEHMAIMEGENKAKKQATDSVHSDMEVNNITKQCFSSWIF